MSKIILKRNPNQLPKKLQRLKHEIRTQPIMTTITIALFAFGLSKCVSPDADAAVPEVKPEMVLVKVQDNYDLRVEPVPTSGAENTTVDFTTLGKSKKVGALMGAYFGVKASKDRPAILPESMDVNWGENLKMLWDKKTNIKNVSPATLKNADRIVTDYANAERDTKSIQVFVSEVGGIVRETHASINYSSLCTAMRIGGNGCSGYKKVMGRFNGLNIVAYGMTEIFPAQNGQYNFRAMDTLLQHAGENYIDSIPALGDILLSKGLYQYTSLAIRRDNSGKLGGANFVDNYAGMKLPGSVLYLNGRNSHKAAFEFAAYNVGNLVKGLSPSQINALANHCSIEDMTQFIAISHHMPSRSARFAHKWVIEGCKKPLINYLDKHLKLYALKTKSNYAALKVNL